MVVVKCLIVFPKYYSSVFQNFNSIHNVYNFKDVVNVDMNTCVLTLSDNIRILSCDNKTCHGPDNISDVFFAECKFVSIPLLNVFNMSISTRNFRTNG